jgi:hypothetical protein
MVDLGSAPTLTASPLAATSAPFGFPPQVTLVDRDGSIIGLMDTRISDYDASLAGQQQRGSRGF